MTTRYPIKFGKYLLLEKLNTGGMAEVYRAKAFGVAGFEKNFAIKKILPHLSEDPEFIAMFIDEAKIAAKLHHANICQVVEFGRVGRGYFLAMEYIAGADLRRISKKFREQRRLLPPPFSIYAIGCILDALDYAHRKTDVTGQPLNIVHRDVSPQNVIVSFDGEIKLIDFGIAKATHRMAKTQAGQIKGKFGYLSPEQIMGRPLDGRSDIFAAAVLLWELLAGRDLFTGETDLEVLRAIIRLQIPSLSKMNPAIPRELEDILAQALQRDPEDRYPTAADFLDALQQFSFRHGWRWGSARDFMAQEFAEELALEREKAKRFADLGQEFVPSEFPPDEGGPGLASPKTVVTFSGRRLLPAEEPEDVFEDSEMTVVLGFSDSDSQISRQEPRPLEPEPGFLPEGISEEDVLELDESDLEEIEEEFEELAEEAERDWSITFQPVPDHSQGLPFLDDTEDESEQPPSPLRLDEPLPPPEPQPWEAGEDWAAEWTDEPPTRADWQALAEPLLYEPEEEMVEELDPDLLEEVPDEQAMAYEPDPAPLQPHDSDSPNGEQESDEQATVYDPGIGPLKPIYDDEDPERS